MVCVCVCLCVCVCVCACMCVPAHLSLSLVDSAFMEDTFFFFFFGKYCSGSRTFGMWVSVSVTVKPSGFLWSCKRQKDYCVC